MVPLLLKEGFDVAGLDSDLYEGSIFGDQSTNGSVPNVTYSQRYIRDAQLSDLKGFDAVVHLAALSNDPLWKLRSRP